MKQKKLLFSLFGICLLLAFISCSEEDKRVFGDDFEIPELTDANTIEFTIHINSDWKQLEVIAGGGRMAIEWGDGRLQKIEKPDMVDVIYRYGNQKSYRVRIWAEELAYLYVGNGLVAVSDCRIGRLTKMKKLSLNGFTDTKSIDMSTSCPNLEQLQLGNLPDLESLFMSGCKELKSITIASVPKLTSFDCEHYPNLTTIFYSSEGLVSLSLKDCPKLTAVRCWQCADLSELEVDDNNVINVLDIDNCAFSSAEFLKKMPLLDDLNCSSNKLVKLDLTKNEKIVRLNCSNNQLESISLSPLNILHDVYCHTNHLTASALNHIFEGLRDYRVGRASPLNYPKLSFYENKGSEGCDRTVFQKKRWSEMKKDVYGR